MQWYDNALQSLEAGTKYSRLAILEQMQKEYPFLSKNSLQWAIGGMLQSGKLKRIGFDEYIIPSGNTLPMYVPRYSDFALKLMEIISQKFSFVPFTIFETVLMNEFLNHLISQNTVFIQVGKETSVFVFRFLQEQGYQGLMFKPSSKEFTLYWVKDSIIITDLISEAPINKEKPHDICIEKMIVDMYCDKLISGTYGKSEFASVVKQVSGQYLLEKPKLLRYARRRNKEDEIARILEENAQGVH